MASNDEYDDWWEHQDDIETEPPKKVPPGEYTKPSISGLGKYQKEKTESWKNLTKAEMAVEFGAVPARIQDWIRRVPNNTPFLTEAIVLMTKLVDWDLKQDQVIDELFQRVSELEKELAEKAEFLDSLAQAEKEGRLSWTGMVFATSPVRLLASGRVVKIDD